MGFNETPDPSADQGIFVYHFPDGHVHAHGEDADDDDEPLVQTFTINDPSPGLYTIVVQALDNNVEFEVHTSRRIGVRHPHVFLFAQVLVASEASLLPALPSNAHIGWYPTSSTGIDLAWNASPDNDVEYCVYAHNDEEHESSDVHGSPCGVEDADLQGCGVRISQETLLAELIGPNRLRQPSR